MSVVPEQHMGSWLRGVTVSGIGVRCRLMNRQDFKSASKLKCRHCDNDICVSEEVPIVK